MTKIQVIQLAMGARVTVPEEVVEPNIGYLPWFLGETLATQVHAYSLEQRLGYFPALDYFRDRPEAVEPELLQLIDEIARFCADYAEREFRRRLSRVFSNVKVEQASSIAYTLPRVRPSQPDALAQLARHYSPDQVKLELLLSSIEKAQLAEGLEGMAAHKVARWMESPFPGLELLHPRRLAAG